jgi:insertion element IS1 protein InsB
LETILIIPKEKHIKTKAETYTVERYNSLFRHFLARMRIKSKCYSKKIEMLKLSFLLLMHYLNGTLFSQSLSTLRPSGCEIKILREKQAKNKMQNFFP